MISTNLLVLGGGMEPGGYESFGTRQRAFTAFQYYADHFEVVERIVCSGAYSGSMKIPPKEGATEAGFTAEYLIDRGVPEDIVKVEDKSGNTFDNMKFVAAKGLFDGQKIDEEHPLGIVTLPAQYWRARLIAQKAFCLDKPDIQNIPVDEPAGPLFRAGQWVGGVVTAVSLWGKQPGNLEDLDAAHNFFSKTLRRPA